MLGTAFRQLQIVLDLPRLMPGGDAAIDPGGAPHRVAAAFELRCVKDIRDINDHVAFKVRGCADQMRRFVFRLSQTKRKSGWPTPWSVAAAAT